MLRREFIIKNKENLLFSSGKLLEMPVFLDFNHNTENLIGLIYSIGVDEKGNIYIGVEFDEQKQLVQKIFTIGIEYFELNPSFIKIGDRNQLTSVSLCSRKQVSVFNVNKNQD